MPGAPDPVYVAARQALLDALEAIAPHLPAVVLVGAQAVYVHAGEAEIAVSPYTTDGDLALDPNRLRPEPLLDVALHRAGFSLVENAVGIWQVSVAVNKVMHDVTIDLLVPESLGGRGHRAARIPPHARLTARNVVGLEGALVDRDISTIGALDPEDGRKFELLVAGPAALIVAKLHKITDRKGDPDRSSDKDAFDVYRLLRVVPTLELAKRYQVLLADPVSSEVAKAAKGMLLELLGRSNAPGTQMAVRAAYPLEDSQTLAASVVALTHDLVGALS